MNNNIKQILALIFTVLSLSTVSAGASGDSILSPTEQKKILATVKATCAADVQLCPRGVKVLFQDLMCTEYSSECDLIYTIFDKRPNALVFQITGGCPFENISHINDFLDSRGQLRNNQRSRLKDCLKTRN
jgi:hypothetical protein